MGVEEEEPQDLASIAVQRLLDAGHILRALSRLSAEVANGMALILDHEKLFDLCVARVAVTVPRAVESNSAGEGLRAVVEYAIEQLLLHENTRSLGNEDDAAWDSAELSKSQFQGFGRSPAEARHNAVRFNALPFETRRAFFVATGRIPSNEGPAERQLRTNSIRDSRERCMLAVQVLLGREDSRHG